jgi:hypothetical protein
MLVKTKSGTLFRASGGLDGPRVDVIVRPTSRAIYNPAAKNAAVRK